MIQYDLIGRKINYGGIELKNRIIFAPTTMGLKKDEYFRKLEEIAAGGCAMIIIGDVPVGKNRFVPSLYNKRGIKYYSEICERIHKYDCKVCAQLHQNDTQFKGMKKYIPQLITGKIDKMDLRRLMNEATGDYISSIPEDDVREITASFGEAAVQAEKIGFDMVQVHGDRMCGSFSSSIFNHRYDRYGGCVEFRTRFATECVKAIREKLPDIPIDYKLTVRQENPHYGNAGVAEEELSVFVPALEKAGVTSFHVTLANHSRLEDPIPAYNHPDFGEQGCFLKFCDEVRQYTTLQVCGVGGLNDPEFINEQLSSGRIDCAAMSRQLIADPEWVNKVLSNKVEKIKRCVRCNKKCLEGMYRHQGVHCIYEGGE